MRIKGLFLFAIIGLTGCSNGNMMNNLGNINSIGDIGTLLGQENLNGTNSNFRMAHVGSSGDNPISTIETVPYEMQTVSVQRSSDGNTYTNVSNGVGLSENLINVHPVGVYDIVLAPNVVEKVILISGRDVVCPERMEVISLIDYQGRHNLNHYKIPSCGIFQINPMNNQIAFSGSQNFYYSGKRFSTTMFPQYASQVAPVPYNAPVRRSYGNVAGNPFSYPQAPVSSVPEELSSYNGAGNYGQYVSTGAGL